MSKSDPVCVLYKQEAGGWREVGRTEQVKLNLTFLSNFEFLIYFSVRPYLYESRLTE